MPQGLSPNLFSGGAVSFNSDEFTKNYLTQLAHDNAQKEATFKYFGELGSRLTPTGMVDEDAQTLMQKKNEWQAYNISHKNQLGNTMLDKGEAWAESNRRLNEMQDLIQKSKYKSDFAKTYLKPILDDPKRTILRSDDMIQKQMQAALPVSNPNYRPMTTADITLKNKPFDAADEARLMPQLARIGKNDYGEPQIVRNEKSGTQTATKNLKFSNDSIQAMRNMGEMVYHSNPGFREKVDGELDPTSPEFAQHNATLREHLGRDIGATGDPAGDIVLAHMIELNPTPRQTVQTGKIMESPIAMQQLRDKESKERIAMREGYINARQDKTRLQKIGDAAAQKKYVDDNFDEEWQNKGQAVQIPKADGTSLTAYPIKTLPEIEKKLVKKDSDGKPTAPMIVRDEKGTTYGVVLNKKGDAMDEKLSSSIPIEDAKTTYQNYRFGKEKAYGTTPAKPKPSAKIDRLGLF